MIAGADWTTPFSQIAGESGVHVAVCASVTRIERHAQAADTLIFSSPAYDGKLVRQHIVKKGSAFITVTAEADFPVVEGKPGLTAWAVKLPVKPDWIAPLPPVSPPTLGQADVIIDLGYGIRDREGYALALELKKKLEELGIAPLFGATRKVTQDLKLLPLETQIGQTGVRVNPRLIIALGISGAPQHIDYVGTRAEIICFNKDAEAPLMKLNQTRKAPRVHPVPGDLFKTVRELIKELG